jgi:hypothetical protein
MSNDEGKQVPPICTQTTNQKINQAGQPGGTGKKSQQTTTVSCAACCNNVQVIGLRAQMMHASPTSSNWLPTADITLMLQKPALPASIQSAS